MNKRATDIVAYCTLIGWLVAYVAGTKEESKFHLNQALILDLACIASGIISFILGFIPIIGGIIGALIGLAVFACWVIALVFACLGEEKEIPFISSIKVLK